MKIKQTLIEKIVQNHAIGLEKDQKVKSLDYIYIRPSYVMTHDNTGAVIPKFNGIGAKFLANPRQVIIALDHNVQDKSENVLLKYQKIEDFAKNMEADFYPAGRGIGHQIMCEEGYAFPGKMAVASDSHSNIYGGLGCLGTPVVRTDAASIWATGKTWWQIPPIVKVELRGKLNPGVFGKDIIIALCGFFNNDEVLNCAIEFTGNGIDSLSIEERLTIANMTTEWGALAGVFPIDSIVIEWLKRRALFIKTRGLEGVASDVDGKGEHPRLNLKTIEELDKHTLKADEGAFYSKEFFIDLSGIEPVVSGPDTVKISTPISEISKKNIKIHKAYLLSCVNARLEDFAEAAKIVKGKTVAPGVKFYIAAASHEIQTECEKLGYWEDLINSGAIPLPSGCGPCIGLGTGLLEDNEVGIAATNRNFKGRMGSKKAQTYLASPAVVAASAIAGKICGAYETKNNIFRASSVTRDKEKSVQKKIKITAGFYSQVEGNLIFCPQDNLNTDGIYPGKYTYIDDFTPQQQANVVMENYDPKFQELAKYGDILAGGFNFGTGSSREQAATAFKNKGIKMIIAGSFSETYKRNAINNGFLTIDSPEFIKHLKDQYGETDLTVTTNSLINIDFENSIILFNGLKFSFSPIGTAAQELIVSGGLENWIKKNIN